MPTSFLIGLIAVLINLAGILLVCSLMAYALVRLRWHSHGLAVLLATILAAGLVWIIPTSIVPAIFGVNDFAPVLAFTFGNGLVAAFAVALLCQRARDIPRVLEDSARLDGCGWGRIYWHVLIPLVRMELILIALMAVVATALPLLVTLKVRDGNALYELVIGPRGATGILLVSLIMILPAIGTFLLAKRYLKEPARPQVTRD